MRRVSIVGMPVSAEVAELADAQASGACGGNPVGVQIPPSAPEKLCWDRSVVSAQFFCVPWGIEPPRGRECEGGNDLPPGNWSSGCESPPANLVPGGRHETESVHRGPDPGDPPRPPGWREGRGSAAPPRHQRK